MQDNYTLKTISLSSKCLSDLSMDSKLILLLSISGLLLNTVMIFLLTCSSCLRNSTNTWMIGNLRLPRFFHIHACFLNMCFNLHASTIEINDCIKHFIQLKTNINFSFIILLTTVSFVNFLCIIICELYAANQCLGNILYSAFLLDGQMSFGKSRGRVCSKSIRDQPPKRLRHLLSVSLFKLIPKLRTKCLMLGLISVYLVSIILHLGSVIISSVKFGDQHNSTVTLNRWIEESRNFRVTVITWATSSLLVFLISSGYLILLRKTLNQIAEFTIVHNKERINSLSNVKKTELSQQESLVNTINTASNNSSSIGLQTKLCTADDRFRFFDPISRSNLAASPSLREYFCEMYEHLSPSLENRSKVIIWSHLSHILAWVPFLTGGIALSFLEDKTSLFTQIIKIILTAVIMLDTNIQPMVIGFREKWLCYCKNNSRPEIFL